MGGKNHQPCSGYLPDSTRLSRRLSMARVQLELANIALEDIILAELEEDTGQIDPMLTGMNSSLASLDEALQSVRDLRARMDTNMFEDLPSLRHIDLEVLGHSLAEQGIVKRGAWHLVSETMLSGGFYKMLEKIEAGIKSLLDQTEELRRGAAGLSGVCDKGEVAVVLEQNLEGNIRATFAQLFTAWAEFDHMFMASAVLNTELWYSFCGYGSMGHATLKTAVA